MKFYHGRLRAAATAILALLFSVCAGLFVFNVTHASAETAENGYYSQLTPAAQRFYGAIAEMDKQGLLKQGNAEYDLIGGGVLTDAQLDSYAVSSDVLVAFGAARDAYSLDHPETFYIDFTYLSVSVGRKNGAYVATLGTGRSDTYYIDGGFASVEEVNAAVASLDGVVGAVASEAETADTEVEKIRSVNARLVEKITYSFCAEATADGTVYKDGAAFIRNPYGALVNGFAVCEGYARAFKMIMDRLGIENVIVQGYGGTDYGYEAHMWNYVKLDGAWYAVDVTWNDTSGAEEDYLLRGNAVMKLEHVPDGVVSESNYEFTYPALNAYDYGVTVDSNGISVEGDYRDNGILVLKVSYNGMSAETLASEEHRYIAYRYRQLVDGELEWGVWIWLGGIGGEDYGTYSTTLINSYIQYIQFAVIDYAPDSSNWYDSDKLTDRHMGEFSEPYVNYAFGTYSAPPYVKSVTPSNQSSIKADQSYEVVVTYTDRLKKADGSKDIGVVFTSRHADIAEYASVTDVIWDAAHPDTLKFTFTPSKMFNHRYETYSFYTVNLVGEESGKEPNTFSLMTEQTSVACSKIYGDGRLYIKTYGEPSLVSSGDLSLTGWQDENGNYVSQNQRSQLMLVVNRPDGDTAGDMLKSAAETAEVAESAVLAGDTYELELDICSHIAKIPNRSYMQLAFGFPAGYGPDDAGVTFKVYHFKRGDDGKIDYGKTEELECVITEYGIIVTVTDFSPFAIVALDKASVSSTSKAIYARTVGFGGSVEGGAVEGGAVEGGAVVTVSEGNNVTYVFSPENGYKVDRVLLNGNAVEITDNALTLEYGDLQENNVLTVSFVAERVALREAEEGITHIYPSVVISLPLPSMPSCISDDATVKGIIAVCVALAVSAVIIATTAVCLRKKKK